MGEKEQYSPHEFSYPGKETNENTNFRWEELEAKQGSQEEIETISNWLEG